MTTTPLPTVGRILHAYSNLWSGPRPAVVSNYLGRADMVNANVLFDGANDPEALAEVRRSPSGNTFTSVRVFAALSDADRALALKDAAAEQRQFGDRDLAIIFEWPPRS